MKKRVLSMLLAVTMLLSLLPMTVFAVEPIEVALQDGESIALSYTAPTYAITNGTPEGDNVKNHGYITVDKTTVAEGETVTVTVNPAEGYKLASLTYKGDGDVASANITVLKAGKYVFTMPEKAVTVSATFEKLPTVDATLYWGLDETTKSLYLSKTDTAISGKGLTPNSFDSTTVYTNLTRPWKDVYNGVEYVEILNDIVPGNTSYWFYDMKYLTEIKGIGYMDTSNVSSMKNMFDSCSSLTSLDLSGFDTSNVTDMQSMFSFCRALKKFTVSSFNTSKVTSLANMFNSCYLLATLDVSNFDTSNVVRMSNLFKDCKSLKEIDLSTFNTSSMTQMDGIFSECISLESVDLSSFDTSKVIAMTGEFQNCYSLKTLDLSNFDLSTVKMARSSFKGMRLAYLKTPKNLQVDVDLPEVTAPYVWYNADTLKKYDGTTFPKKSAESLTLAITLPVTVDKDIANGTVSVKTNLPDANATAGSAVTVTVTPDKDYKLKSLTCTPKLSDWSVVGDFSVEKWAEDIPMVETVPGVFVSSVLTLSEDAQFKVRKNANWTENYGVGDPSDIKSVKVGDLSVVVPGGGNVTVSDAGTYVVILDLNNTQIIVTSASKSPVNPVKITAGKDGSYAFTMPDYPVTVTAEFEAAESVSGEKEIFNPQNASVDHTWGEFDDPEASWNQTTGTLTIQIISQGGFQWGNQVFLDTGIKTLDTTKEYQVSFTATASTVDCGGVTFKAFDNNAIAFANQNIPLTTTPFNYVSDWKIPSSASANGLIVFDFGWDRAQTVTITNISIKERTPVHNHNLVKVTGQAATESAAGWKDYYECKDSTDACHKYFEDENGTTPIENLNAWKAQGGNGYIPSGNEINAAKTAAKAALDTENGKDPLIDESALTNGKSVIDSAENLANIENAKNNAIRAIKDAQASELAAAKELAKTALDEENAKDPLEDETVLINAKNNVDKASNKAGVEKAKADGISDIISARENDTTCSKCGCHHHDNFFGRIFCWIVRTARYIVTSISSILFK